MNLHLDEPPLAGGGFRDVHQHPGDPGLLVKVLRSDRSAMPPPGPFGIRRRYGPYAPYLREIREYLAVRARFAACPAILQGYYGLAETNRGLGMVVEKLCGHDGGLAPSVAAVARTAGISTRLWELCEHFYDEVRRHELVIGDLNPRNIVWAVDGAGDRLVLVDGLGEKMFIPLRSLSPAYNRYQLERGIKRSKLRIMQYATGRYRPGRISRADARQLNIADLLDRPPVGAMASPEAYSASKASASTER